MLSLIQRVSHASVTVDGRSVGAIERGLLIFLGVIKEDAVADADVLARKILKLRVFEDEAGKMNRDLFQVGGAILAVSQFTLAANLRDGNRPGFDTAMPPVPARDLFEHFVAALRAGGATVATGEFGADMKVNLCNDGPATFWLDSRDLR